MSKKTYARLENADELRAKFDELGSRVRASVVTAVHAGAEVVAEAADLDAPADAQLEIKTLEKRGQSVLLGVGLDRNHWYYKFFETGATAHEIKAHDAAAMVFAGRDGLVVTGGVQHPGMAARPFLRPALDGRRDEVVAMIGDVLRAEIEAVAEKQG